MLACVATWTLSLLPLGNNPEQLEQLLRSAHDELEQRAAPAAMQARLGQQGGAQLSEGLEQSRAALDRGFAWLGLRALIPAWRAVLTAESSLRASAAEPREAAGFAEVSQQASLEFEARVPRTMPASDQPALVQALIGAELSKAWTYLEGVLAFGVESGPAAGFHYLAIARGHADMLGVLGQLSLAPPSDSPPALPGLATLLDALEGELLELYRPPASREDHNQFIRLSATHKFARELAAQGASFAALNEALALRRDLTAYQAGDATPALEDLELLLDECWAELEETGGDHSLMQAFLEEAELLVAEGDGDRARQQRAAALLTATYPAYQACLESTSGADGPAAQVRVTLIRWPFT